MGVSVLSSLPKYSGLRPRRSCTFAINQGHLFHQEKINIARHGLVGATGTASARRWYVRTGKSGTAGPQPATGPCGRGVCHSVRVVCAMCVRCVCDHVWARCGRGVGEPEVPLQSAVTGTAVHGRGARGVWVRCVALVGEVCVTVCARCHGVRFSAKCQCTRCARCVRGIKAGKDLLYSFFQ